jgi:hypothetical protein
MVDRRDVVGHLAHVLVVLRRELERQSRRKRGGEE